MALSRASDANAGAIAKMQALSSGSEAAADLGDGPIPFARPFTGGPEGHGRIAGCCIRPRAPQRLAVLPMAFALRLSPFLPRERGRVGWGTIIMKDSHNV